MSAIPGKLNLIAVQAAPVLSDYRDASSFAAKITSLMAWAGKQADFSLPTLVSFPELNGLYLTFVPFYWDELQEEATMEAASARIVKARWRSLPEEQRATPRDSARQLLFFEHALEAEHI